MVLLSALAGATSGEGSPETSSSTPNSERDLVSFSVNEICLARDWRDVHKETLAYPTCIDPGIHTRTWDSTPPAPRISTSTTSASTSVSGSPSHDETDPELDPNSPLDNANFLSFEDWKKQNLAKVGQSAENVGGGRRGAVVDKGGDPGRRPAGINNVLDSLGEDAEIELDFGGFGAGAPETARPSAWGVPTVDAAAEGSSTAVGGAADERAAGASALQGARETRRRDAGTTCKERSNYASFDCAATVLKTNPECKGSSSVLIENKDSYMLNECRAKNKFLILELCDDILVDTVVLANYEFFSSIFRTFRVSVADRYPAKQDQWKELGVYEAKNTREVQAFAVENPLIWARYLRIEFLTHYGNEFYCPVSLIRVHGTTMMEEYKHDGDASRHEDETVDESFEPGDTIIVDTVEPEATHFDPETPVDEVCPIELDDVEKTLLAGPAHWYAVCTVDESLANGEEYRSTGVSAGTQYRSSLSSGETSASETTTKMPEDRRATTEQLDDRPRSASSSRATADTESGPSPAIETMPREDHAVPLEATRPTTTQPPASNPTTQESFFKSVNKRLQMLESNSTLSLLYIEEQSRILRDAFNKVEKRQLAKTSTFLENLNATVVHELKQFREQYENVWRSVGLEFEHQRIQYHREIESLSTQLGVLADEIVFQKRVSVVQSIMVLFCFGLVLFARGTVGSYIELPAVQSMVSRSYSFRSLSPISTSPSASPSPSRAAPSNRGNPGHRSNLSEDSQHSPRRPMMPYSPPTPTSDTSSHVNLEDKNEQPLPGTMQTLVDQEPLARPASSPPVLHGEADDVEQ